MGYSYNNGLHTSSKGMTQEAVRVTGLNVALAGLCTIAEDSKSGLVARVTHTATGVYTFQLSAPFPPKYVGIRPSISAALPTSALLVARYQSNSYNPTTGQFIVHTSVGGVATDGSATDELMVDLNFRRYTN